VELREEAALSKHRTISLNGPKPANRACYDKAKQFMIVELRSVYYPYCEMPAATFDAFLAAPSMGQYYNTNIKGTGTDGPFDCRTHRLPKY
jgi:hypothetical protein